jgi:hypothetical protein
MSETVKILQAEPWVTDKGGPTNSGTIIVGGTDKYLTGGTG